MSSAPIRKRLSPIERAELKARMYKRPTRIQYGALDLVITATEKGFVYHIGAQPIDRPTAEMLLTTRTRI